LVDFTGVRRKVDLGLIEDQHPVPGDWVLIHVGFAMSKISEAAAKETLELLTMLGEQQAAHGRRRASGIDAAPPGGSPEIRDEFRHAIAQTRRRSASLPTTMAACCSPNMVSSSKVSLAAASLILLMAKPTWIKTQSPGTGCWSSMSPRSTLRRTR